MVFKDKFQRTVHISRNPSATSDWVLTVEAPKRVPSLQNPLTCDPEL